MIKRGLIALAISLLAAITVFICVLLVNSEEIHSEIMEDGYSRKGIPDVVYTVEDFVNYYYASASREEWITDLPDPPDGKLRDACWGNEEYIIVSDKGNVWQLVGDNDNYEFNAIRIPEPIDYVVNFHEQAMDWNSFYAVSIYGNLYTWGEAYGCLYRDAGYVKHPERVEYINDVKYLTVEGTRDNSTYMYAISNNREVWKWGYGYAEPIKLSIHDVDIISPEGYISDGVFHSFVYDVTLENAVYFGRDWIMDRSGDVYQFGYYLDEEYGNAEDYSYDEIIELMDFKGPTRINNPNQIYYFSDEFPGLEGLRAVEYRDEVLPSAVDMLTSADFISCTLEYARGTGGYRPLSICFNDIDGQEKTVHLGSVKSMIGDYDTVEYKREDGVLVDRLEYTLCDLNGDGIVEFPVLNQFFFSDITEPHHTLYYEWLTVYEFDRDSMDFVVASHSHTELISEYYMPYLERGKPNDYKVAFEAYNKVFFFDGNFTQIVIPNMTEEQFNDHYDNTYELALMHARLIYAATEIVNGYRIQESVHDGSYPYDLNSDLIKYFPYVENVLEYNTSD